MVKMTEFKAFGEGDDKDEKDTFVYGPLSIKVTDPGDLHAYYRFTFSLEGDYHLGDTVIHSIFARSIRGQILVLLELSIPECVEQLATTPGLYLKVLQWRLSVGHVRK